MTSASVQRVQFLLQQHSQSEIARETGLSRYMVGRVAAGDRDVPQELRNAVRNYYQRDAYSRMREAGFPTAQARRFSWYSPSTVAVDIAQFQTRVLEFTEGVAASRLEAEYESGVNITQSLENQIYGEAYADILDSLRNSKAPIEDILSERY